MISVIIFFYGVIGTLSYSLRVMRWCTLRDTRLLSSSDWLASPVEVDAIFSVPFPFPFPMPIPLLFSFRGADSAGCNFQLIAFRCRRCDDSCKIFVYRFGFLREEAPDYGPHKEEPCAFM